MLFCAYGPASNFQKTNDPQQYAVAVVEINGQTAQSQVGPVTFDVLDANGANSFPATLFSPVQVFKAPRHPALKGKMGYYRYQSSVSPWDGTLPSGAIRLRVAGWISPRAFSVGFGKCRLRVGPYVIEGPVDGIWPS